jgi:hypothetical protein
MILESDNDNNPSKRETKMKNQLPSINDAYQAAVKFMAQDKAVESVEIEFMSHSAGPMQATIARDGSMTGLRKFVEQSLSEFKTIAVVGFAGSVSRRNYNPAAHGAVCLLQARINTKGEQIGRKVNSNGRHEEVGNVFPLDNDTLSHWESMGN